MILLNEIDDTIRVNDIYPILVKRVKNLKGEKTDKFLIFIEDDVFGLLSYRYFLCNTKELIKDIASNISIEHTYRKGRVFVRILGDKPAPHRIEEETLKVLRVLSDSPVLNTKSRINTYISNSYNGITRLTFGQELQLFYSDDNKEKKISLPITCVDVKGKHVSTLKEQLSLIMSNQDLTPVEKMLDIPFIEEVASALPRTIVQKVNVVMSALPKTMWNFLVSYACVIDSELFNLVDFLGVIQKHINKQKETKVTVE